MQWRFLFPLSPECNNHCSGARTSIRARRKHSISLCTGRCKDVKEIEETDDERKDGITGLVLVLAERGHICRAPQREIGETGFAHLRNFGEDWGGATRSCRDGHPAFRASHEAAVTL
jgi:hypothetical protein